MENSTKNILCVESDKDTCELIEFVFSQKGYGVESCLKISDCIKKIKENNFQAVILEIRFGNLNSIDVCREIREFDTRIPIIIFSGEVRKAVISEALYAGATAYLIKPNDFEKLTDTVINLIKTKNQKYY